MKSVENKIQKAHISILMVCHGNICRSPMAEFVMKDMVKKAGLESRFQIASAATSTEETGNPVHRGTREKLAQVGISIAGKRAVQLKKSASGSPSRLNRLSTATEKRATAVWLAPCEYRTSGSLVNRPIRITLFIFSSRFPIMPRLV